MGSQSDRSKKSASRKRRRTFYIIGLCVCAAAFAAGAYLVADDLIETRKADDAYALVQANMQASAYRRSIADEALPAPLAIPAQQDGVDAAVPASKASSMDFAELLDVNSDITGWLFCEGTAIDYPLLHADDNEYYLTRLYTKESNRMGSLFLDHRNTGLFTEQNTVIYGHNMRNGTMFHTLAEYKSQDFYDTHPTMILYTPAGDYTVELFSGTVEDGEIEFVEFEFANGDAFIAYVESFRARSTFTSNVEISPGDRIVTLCTCSYEHTNARYTVMGRLVPLD